MPKGRRRQPGEGEVSRSAHEYRKWADTMDAERFMDGSRPFKDMPDTELSARISGSRKHLAQTFGGTAAGLALGAGGAIATGGLVPLAAGAAVGFGSLLGFGGGLNRNKNEGMKGVDSHDNRVNIGGKLAEERKLRKNA